MAWENLLITENKKGWFGFWSFLSPSSFDCQFWCKCWLLLSRSSQVWCWWWCVTSAFTFFRLSSRLVILSRQFSFWHKSHPRMLTCFGTTGSTVNKQKKKHESVRTPPLRNTTTNHWTSACSINKQSDFIWSIHLNSWFYSFPEEKLREISQALS